MHGANRLGGNGVANSTVFGGIAGDTMPRLLGLGKRAAAARYDISRLIKGAFFVWMGCLAIAPRPIARRLGELFIFPTRRERVNRVLGRFHVD